MQVKYQAMFAVSDPTVEVEAESDEEAVAKAKEQFRRLFEEWLEDNILIWTLE